MRGRPPDHGEEGRRLSLRHAGVHRETSAQLRTCTSGQQRCCAGVEDAVHAGMHTTHACVSPLVHHIAERTRLVFTRKRERGERVSARLLRGYEVVSHVQCQRATKCMKKNSSKFPLSNSWNIEYNLVIILSSGHL